MSGYNDNAHDTMQGFVSIIEATKLPGYNPSHLTFYIYIGISDLGTKKRDQALINYDSKYKSLNARLFTKVDKTPTPTTDNILKREAIVELRDPDGSSSGTEKYYLFQILGIYDKYYKIWFLCQSGKQCVVYKKRCRVGIQMIDLDRTYQKYRDVSPGDGRYSIEKVCQLVDA